jgi:hypothetical protein
MPDDTGNVAKPAPKKLTITAIVIAATAFVSALGVLLSRTEDVVKNFKTLYKSVTPQSYPYEVAVSNPSEVPSYLRFYYSSDDPNDPHNLHWFRAAVHNKVNRPLMLGVSFQIQPIDCEIVHLDPKAEPNENSLEAGKTESYYITPPIKWTQTDLDQECKLSLKYSVKEKLQPDEYPVKEVPITILPKRVVKWDLTNIDGKAVSKEFLLASLTAWTLSKDEVVVQRAKELRKSVSGGSHEKWAEACYKNLFPESKRGLEIIPTHLTYPFLQQRTRLRSPGEALTNANPEPLEAALLMAALIHNATNEEVSFTLFILPQSQPDQPAVLLAWPDPAGGTSWKAVDLRLAGTSKFDENLQQSSELLQRALSSNPSILDFSKNKGVLFGTAATSPNVISFQQAKNDWNIQPLP